ncbi:hypothetical protein OEZ85_002615 [Tetradesmus obliquus]|uniref:Endonuclease/exonuclease/phosphatase domain-containing protein n=1 Tax=Tetradesmus obliquus TaxID=3088 RepID=A0ABY8TY43_TETOB|nr:hypothetical protein OEZ85_002615 [Tetradesmus obliquus]
MTDEDDDDDAAERGAVKRMKLNPPDTAAPDADAAAAAAAAASGSGSAAAAAAAAGTGFNNSDLRALHEARMRRQQQQQQQQPDEGAKQQEDAAGGSEPASTPAAAAGSSRRRRSRSPPARPAAAKPAAGSSAAAASAGAGSSSISISLLTYNVWFKEEVAVLERMTGLGDIIRRAGLPTFICLQEVTPLILEILCNMEWWQQYVPSPHPRDMAYFTLLLVKRSADPSLGQAAFSHREFGNSVMGAWALTGHWQHFLMSSDSDGSACIMLLVKRSADPSLGQAAFSHREFGNSVMGRGLRSVSASIGGQQVLVATSHLESPIPPQAWYSQERQQQMAEALRSLDDAAAGNVLFAGDMNWDDKRDGAPPLPNSWVDAWATLQPGKPGATYDAKSNPMLPFKGTPALRLDRIICKLRDWRLGSIELVGNQPLPGVTYSHRLRNGGSKELPVLPSDHFGLLLKLEPV